jgi:hypothetical protein
MHWVDQDSYDANKGELVREVAHEFLLSAPQPDLYWGGPVVVLVDQNCASSCEFFTQFLQTNDRVTVVGQYATSGAGAPINHVAMPYGITFQYTKGRAYFAGTDEMNLEAKGVVPDVRVPVTEESAAALVAGEDPVLAAGLQTLNELVGKAAAATIKLVPLTADVTGGTPAEFAGVYPAGWTYFKKPTGFTFQTPDGQFALIYDTATPEEVAELLAPLGITDFAAQLVETHTANDVEWKIVGNDMNGFAYHAAMAEIGGKTYVVTIASPAAIVEQITEALLYPALDAFAPNAGS